MTADRQRHVKNSMNRHVNAIAARLSLRPPQRRSLEIRYGAARGNRQNSAA